MQKMLRKVLSGIVLLVILLSASFVSTQAAEEVDIFAAIDLGVPWLAAQQNADGSWIDPRYGEPIASTGFAVLKLLEYAYENGIDPFDPDYAYNSEVEAGLAYLWDAAEVSDCAGIVFGKGHHETYSTGVAMMAIAATGNPDFVLGHPNPVVNGLSVLQVVQGAVDHFVCAQNPDGGWRYWFEDTPSDNSNTGYATLGLRYAEEFGASVPQTLKVNLSVFIDAIQDETTGGSKYQVDWDWINVLKTGNLLFEMAFVGDSVDAPRVQAALNYIEEHWNDPNSGSIYDTGWYEHNQAMYCLMKGFGAFGIEEIEVSGVSVDWFQDFADDLLPRQQADGSWPWDPWGGSVLATEWALLTLEKIAPPPVEIQVPVDIKPTSCRNPINTKDKGVLPVAILGTEDFDVMEIDPESVRLMGIAPLRWAYEDVATPYEPYIGKEGAFACTTEGPDGYLDLVFHFKTQEVVAALVDVNDGDVIVIPLTGNLSEEFGGTPIVGEDVVVILKKGKK
jgi:hypothetical protein